MIKTLIKKVYSQPSELPKEAYIQLDAFLEITNVAAILNIKHFAIIDDTTLAKQELFSVKKEISQTLFNSLVNEVNTIIGGMDTTEITEFDLYQLRIKLLLYLYVTTFDLTEEKTIWGLDPNQWETVNNN